MQPGKRITRRKFLEASIAGGVALGQARNAQSGPASVSVLKSDAPGPSLEVVGDPQHGYGVSLLYNGRRIARHNAGGEFSAIFQNGERSVEDRVTNWKAETWTWNGTSLILRGQCKLPSLNATVLVQVEYDVVGTHVIRKRVRFHQVDMDLLFYEFTNRLEALAPPAKFWSFDQMDCRGGALREYFPAVGFRTGAGLTVGLLTDSGAHNQWSRMIRRDGKPIKPAARQIPDPNLNYVCRPNERDHRGCYVQQTFGEMLTWNEAPHWGEIVNLPPVPSWIKKGRASVAERDGALIVASESPEDSVLMPFRSHDGDVYSLRFEYKARRPFALQMWDVGDRMQLLSNLTLYDDRVPGSPSGWTEFHSTVFFCAQRGEGGALLISGPQTQQAANTQSPAAESLQIRNLELRRLAAHTAPYHRLEMDRSDAKAMFIFMAEDVSDTLRGYRLASETHLSDGLGFKGSETEKVLYADVMMLSWAAAPHYFHPMLAPSIWYSAAGEMYLRDSFYAINGVHNRELNERIWNLWAANQGLDGAINTLVEPNMANLERKSNDSTPLWLMWALQNRRRFGAKLPADKIRRAAEYCIRTYDRRHDGVCWAQFVMGQLDVISYPQGTSAICENQGMLAVTLRVIKELQIPGISEGISENYISKAEAVYRSYYDPVEKFVRPARNIKDAVGFGSIFPEFLSLWLFKRKLLTDEMILNHLDRIPVMMPRQDAPHPDQGGTVRPIFIGLTPGGKGWSYFSATWHPMVDEVNSAGYANHGMDGIYYNGGSWMRIEICGYVAGKLHGWKHADKAIANRLWAETHNAPDFPTSQEYLATDPAHPFFGYHRVFAWNSFVLQALEMAGLRKPEMDPDCIIPSSNRARLESTRSRGR